MVEDKKYPNRYKKGHTPWSKGKKLTMLSESRKGKGNPMFGKEPWNKNRRGLLKHTMEWKERASLIAKSNTKIKATQFKKGQVLHNKGKNTPVEVKLKQSNIRNKFYKEHPEWIDNWFENTRKNLVVPVRDTKIELKLQYFLKQLNIKYYPHQYINSIEHAYQCDIFVPSLNLIIEADGDYWHHFPFGNDIDHIRTKELIEEGFKVLRLWERDINKMDVQTFKEMLYV